MSSIGSVFFGNGNKIFVESIYLFFIKGRILFLYIVFLFFFEIYDIDGT